MAIVSFQDKLEFLIEKASGGEMSSWEEDFVADIDVFVTQDVPLSTARQEKLDELWERYGT